MTAKIRQQGSYELFETTEHHRILVLDGKEWFAWIRGERSPILVKSDSDHQKDHTISKGDYYLVDFQNDPDFEDQPHLFYQEGDRFHELVLPNGLPTSGDERKRLVETDDTVGRDKLEQHLKAA